MWHFVFIEKHFWRHNYYLSCTSASLIYIAFPHRYFGSEWRTLPLNFFDGCRSFWFGSLSLNAEEWRKKSAGGFSPPHSPRFVNERFSHCHLFSFCRQRAFFEHWIFKSLNFFIRIGVLDNLCSYLPLWGYHFCLHRASWSAQCSAMFWTWNRCMDCPARARSARARRACALRALGLLLADGAPTVGRGKTFWRVN